jgi:Rod binding domain-containing protein
MLIQGTAGTGHVFPPDQPKTIEQAAEAFEGMFLSQLLRLVREGGNQAQLGEGDAAGGTMMEVAEEQLAAAVAKSGGLGFARSVIEQLRGR